MKVGLKVLFAAAVASSVLLAPLTGANAEGTKYRVAYIARAQGDSFAA